MTIETRRQCVDELIEKAAASLAAGSIFEVERMAIKALNMSRQLSDYARMQRVISALIEARQARLEAALAAGEVTIVREPVTESDRIAAGCYLVGPPQVGADARRLRLAALNQEAAVVVVCREPLTRVGLLPVVAVGTGITVRVRIPPPQDLDAPDMEWFRGALEAVGDAAIGSVDTAMDSQRRVDVLLQRLDAVPEHVAMHQFLLECCREADLLTQQRAARRRTRRGKAQA